MTEVKVITGDITKVSGYDAIVNAANTSLLGGGGVDGAIHKAAGKGLLAECKTLGGCKTGQAKVTKGYRLPCKYVIHTVGPVWKSDSTEEEKSDMDKLLAHSYKNSLLTAIVQKDIRNIAFPSISTGAYRYPLDRAAKVAASAIKEIVNEYPDAFDRITVVAFDTVTGLAYSKYLNW